MIVHAAGGCVNTKGALNMPNLIGEITRKSYDKDTLTALVECCSRLFFCDEEIVIVDFLLASEHAVSEKDLETELGISERRIREFLSRLEHHGIINRITTTSQHNILQRNFRREDGREISSSQSFWRLNSNLILVIHYKLCKMEEILQQRRKSLYEHDKFICPTCNSTYDGLEVQKLDMDIIDAHFICNCGSKVELDDRMLKEDIYTSQQKRCEEQVQGLKRCLYEAWGMEIPDFPIYVRKTAAQQLVNNAENTSVVGTNSAAGDASSVVSENSSTTTTMEKAATRSLVSDPAKSDFTSERSNKIKFHMKVNTKPMSLAGKAPKPSSDSMLCTTKTEGKNVISQEKKEEIKADAVEERMPDFFISKLGKHITLLEAQDYQQDMTNDEFENFVELQDKYLNTF